MQEDEFINRVQRRTGLRMRVKAEAAIRATLETLAERLSGVEPYMAAAQLPALIKEYLTPDWAGAGISFSLDEFYRRVGEREGVERSQAIHHAHSVMQVLSEALSEGEMDRIRAQFPPEFNPLFEANTQENISSR